MVAPKQSDMLSLAKPIEEYPCCIYSIKRHTGDTAWGRIDQLFRGTFDGAAATFIRLKIHHKDHRRVESSKITIEIHHERDGEDGKRIHLPRFVAYRPQEHYGVKTRVDHNRVVEGEAELGMHVFPAMGSLRLAAARGKAYQKNSALFIGCCVPPEQGGLGKVLEVNAEQDETTKGGLLSEVPIGFVVVHGPEKFAISLLIDFKLKPAYRIFPVKQIGSGAHTDPVLITDQTREQKKPENINLAMHEWGKEEWEELVKIHEDGVAVIWGY